MNNKLQKPLRKLTFLDISCWLVKRPGLVKFGNLWSNAFVRGGIFLADNIGFVSTKALAALHFRVLMAEMKTKVKRTSSHHHPANISRDTWGACQVSSFSPALFPTGRIHCSVPSPLISRAGVCSTAKESILTFHLSHLMPLICHFWSWFGGN